MLVKNIDTNTKEAKIIFRGSDTSFAKSHGFEECDVEKAYNGKYYLVGYAPQKSKSLLAEEIRKLRDFYLRKTDFTQISDVPFDTSKKLLYAEYRQYLRDLPQSSEFPSISVMTFDEWHTTQLSTKSLQNE